MADVNLAKLYNTGEFADCTFVSSEGQKFEAHRFLLSQYPRLKELIDEDQRLKLTESTEVTERLVRWLYGLDWEPENVQPTRVGIGKELTDIISLCGAAEKYAIPKLAEDAYAAVGTVLAHIRTPEVALHVLRDLAAKDTVAGVLQRTLADRVLSLLPREISAATGQRKRKRETDGERRAEAHVLTHQVGKAEAADAYDEVIIVPERPERVKKPTAKAKQTPQKPPRKSSSSSRKSSMKAPAEDSIERHCVCDKPEDPYLVQCDHCKCWFHPGCVGKGKYAEASYKHARKVALAGDEKMYREQNLMFTCADCDEDA